jgi:eukaryotic-like serine/threonine-protein kinase
MKPEEILQFGEFAIYVSAHAVTRDNKPLTLNRRAFDVLLYMARNPGRVLSKDELLKSIWTDAFVNENSLTQSISMLRKALDEAPGASNYIMTLPGRGYQFIAPVRTIVPECDGTPDPEIAGIIQERIVRTTARTSAITEIKIPPFFALFRSRLATMLAISLAVTGAAVTAFATWKHFHRVPVFPVVVIADFRNETGDPSMDYVLDTAIEIDLRQSPYLSFLSLARVRETLAQMQRKKESALTRDVAREICQRNNAQVVLTGVIAKFGLTYLLTLEATDCGSGDVIARSKREAAGPDGVPHAIDQVAADLRDRLGESQASIHRYNAHLFAENTGSLAALEQYSEAIHLASKGRYGETVPLLQRAIELDPQFAMAYADLAGTYVNLGEHALAAANFTKAYELRDTVAEQDRLFIIASYHDNVTGDLHESIRNLRTWTNIYPRNPTPWSDLADLYTQLGTPELGIEAARRGLSLDPERSVAYTILARCLLHSGQFDAAKSVADQAQIKALDGADLHSLLMQIAAARHDRGGIDAQIAWARTHPDGSRIKANEAMLAFAEGDAHRGQEFFQESARSYKDQGLDRLSTYTLLASTRMLAEEGHTLEARKLLDTLPTPSGMTDPVVAMAEVGEETRALAIVKQELARHPADTLWTGNKGPQIQAAIFLARHQTREAIDVLRPSIPYDLRNFDLPLLRGRAYLADHQPAAAELEFRKILDHPGVDPLSYEYPLAQLELARALTAKGEVNQSHAEYEKFLNLWKDADPDEPLLRAARQENRRLVSKTSPN